MTLVVVKNSFKVVPKQVAINNRSTSIYITEQPRFIVRFYLDHRFNFLRGLGKAVTNNKIIKPKDY